MSDPLVSVALVTEGREAFIPWFIWNINKQSYRNLEVIIVDSSEDGGSEWFSALDQARIQFPIQYIRQPLGATVGHKMNIATKRAQGDLLIKVDDDDWQHPDRITRLVDLWLFDRPAVVGTCEAYYLDLKTRLGVHYQHASVVHSLCAVDTAFAKTVPWDETKKRASDTAWLAAVKARGAKPVADHELLSSIWLVHGQNLNMDYRKGLRFKVALSQIIDRIGIDAWGDTSKQLNALAARLDKGGE